MKPSVFTPGILGLASAVLLPGASAQTVLFQENFDTDAFLKASTTFIQGVGTATMGDDTIDILTPSLLPISHRDRHGWLPEAVDAAVGTAAGLHRLYDD